MSWYEKDRPTPFDDKPIEGLWFLDGDMLAWLYEKPWTLNQKYPVIVFPSGQECAIWESSDPNNAGVMHLFGEMDLRYNDTRNEAYEYAQHVAEQCGYYVERVGENQLKVVGHDPDEQMIVTYDNKNKRIADVALVEDDPYEQPVHPAHRLMTEEIKEQLPKLYANEEIGDTAIAPVKYFHPLSEWTWYASEFDGEDILYGLVIGHEIEYGYFSLSELANIAEDGHTLPIERDLDYKPMCLKDLKEMHQRERKR